MYKVFFNENLVAFTDANTVLTGFRLVKFKDLDFQFFLRELREDHSAKINVICDNLENDWIRFLLNFEIRKAAGGVVKNQLDELLWIYRFDKWDLPKGHVENEESNEVAAIREVEEECSVFGLKIERELQTTYHVFKHKNKNVLKVTYWFLMKTEERQPNLAPQLEEGITDVGFKSIAESKKCLENTYGNIKILLSDIISLV
ncbi:NUDIX hydrolase [Wenyingzhuangia sp. 2_MG-2023]|uniref:NUDIX hydrolase n=1 Tax=Wenyingzhuangia sp. 2_MG-2023 TaxID=3062639 RepID=UPI0026E45CAA|nr:NUDIX domain-containing protein [Wenyingzhuangia sp. 2_MG-2023]MDO6737817.1 NUDIX domain-containing protein [Wenyingzhuangia sp. 2_MG-2023]